MNRSDTITIDKIKNSIPINAGITNFVAEIKIDSSSDKEFSLAIVSKSLLETTADLPFKTYSKQVSFTVKNENDKYEPYFMVLQSETPQEVLINISLKELSKTITQLKPTLKEGMNGDSAAPWYKDWKYWAIILAVVAIFVYFYLKNNKKKEPVVILDEPLSIKR